MKHNKTINETETVGKTETFFTRHVKLTAFLLTLALFLVLFTPIAILEAKDYFSKKGDDRPEMTTTDLILLMDRKASLTLNDFTAYIGREMEGGEGDYRYYYIEFGGQYLLTVAAGKTTGRVEMCLLHADGTDDSIDLMSPHVDVRAYFAGDPYRVMTASDIQSLATKKNHLLLSDFAQFRNMTCDESDPIYNYYRTEVASAYAVTLQVKKTGGSILSWKLQRISGADSIDIINDNVDLTRYFAGTAYWVMTRTDLMGLFETKDEPMREDLLRYAGSPTSDGYKITFERHYYVLVTVDSTTDKVKSCILSDTNVADGKYKVDLMTSEVDLKAFFEGNSYQTMTQKDLIEVMKWKKDGLKMLDFTRFIGTEADGAYRIDFDGRYSIMLRAEVGTGKIESCILTDTSAPAGENPVELMTSQIDLEDYFESKS